MINFRSSSFYNCFTYVTGDIRNRSGSLSSGVSHSSSEADISKDSDISKDLLDNSDLDVTPHSTRTSKTCVQRLFSPDIRHNDHVIDPLSSPESVTEHLVSTSFDRLPPLTEVINNPSVVLVKPKPVHALKGSHHVTTVSAQKSKIWSISEIIGGAATAVETDHQTQYPPNNCVTKQTALPSMHYPYSYASYGPDYSQYQTMHGYSNSSYMSELLQSAHDAQTADSDPVLYL